MKIRLLRAEALPARNAKNERAGRSGLKIQRLQHRESTAGSAASHDRYKQTLATSNFLGRSIHEGSLAYDDSKAHLPLGNAKVGLHLTNA